MTDVPALFLPGLAGHAAEFAGLALLWPGPALCLDPPVDGDLTIAGQAHQLAGRAAAAGFTRFVVVGHSQGGIVALHLAVTRPDLVAGVVLLDAPVLVPAPLRAAMRLFGAALATPLGGALLRAFFRATFAAADGDRFRAEVMARLAAVPRRSAHRIVAAAFGFDGAAALRAVRVPATYVRANIPTPLDRLPPHVRGHDLGGAGHWVHVHRAAEVGALLNELAAAGLERS
jgi:pimeloyl-ACP methyl ester carboxylesterase